MSVNEKINYIQERLRQDPSEPEHYVNKRYADLIMWNPVDAVADAGLSGTYSGDTLTLTVANLTIDGVALKVGSRVLLTAQALPVQNGLYTCIGLSNVRLKRAADANAAAHFYKEKQVVVKTGTKYGGRTFHQTSLAPTNMNGAKTFTLYTPLIGAATAVLTLTAQAAEQEVQHSIGSDVIVGCYNDTTGDKIEVAVRVLGDKIVVACPAATTELTAIRVVIVPGAGSLFADPLPVGDVLSVGEDGMAWQTPDTVMSRMGEATTTLKGLMPAADKVKVDSVRRVATGTVTLYVREGGDDTNAGTLGYPFATIGRALEELRLIDFKGNFCHIDIGPGDWIVNGSVGIYVRAGFFNGATLTIRGAGMDKTTITPIVATGTGVEIQTGNSRQIILEKFKIGPCGHSIFTRVGTNVVVTDLEFSAATSTHISTQGGMVSLNHYTISGGTPAHLNLSMTGHMMSHSKTVTINNSPAIGTFANLSDGSHLFHFNNTFVNKETVTGRRYLVDTDSTILTLGRGENYFPGTTDGIVRNDSYYN